MTAVGRRTALDQPIITHALSYRTQIDYRFLSRAAMTHAAELLASTLDLSTANADTKPARRPTSCAAECNKLIAAVLENSISSYNVIVPINSSTSTNIVVFITVLKRGVVFHYTLCAGSTDSPRLLFGIVVVLTLITYNSTTTLLTGCANKTTRLLKILYFRNCSKYITTFIDFAEEDLSHTGKVMVW